jgi:hypothetical protein
MPAQVIETSMAFVFASHGFAANDAGKAAKQTQELAQITTSIAQNVPFIGKENMIERGAIYPNEVHMGAWAKLSVPGRPMGPHGRGQAPPGHSHTHSVTCCDLHTLRSACGRCCGGARDGG